MRCKCGHDLAQKVRYMPRYRCRLELWAVKIKAVELRKGPFGANIPTLVPEGDYGPFEVSLEFMEEHKPQADGYYLVYGDGHTSFCPALDFEKRYVRA